MASLSCKTVFTCVCPLRNLAKSNMQLKYVVFREPALLLAAALLLRIRFELICEGPHVLHLTGAQA